MDLIHIKVSFSKLALIFLFLTKVCISLPENSPYRNYENIIDLGDGYIIGKLGVTNKVAKQMCHFAKKELVSIETIDEDKLILSLLKKGAPNISYVWTSGHNSLHHQVWAWANGDPLYHTRWWVTHPVYDKASYCLALHEQKYNRYWFAAACDTAYMPLCETKGNETLN